MKYIVNRSGGVHSVPDTYVYVAGDRDATGEEIADYQAAFEDHTHDAPRVAAPLLPDVPTHNPPPAPTVTRFAAPPETLPSPPPQGTPVADTKPNPPEWAKKPRVKAGQQAVLPDTPQGQAAEDGPVPVATDLEASSPTYTDPAQRTEDAGLPAGSYPPPATEQGLSVPDQVQPVVATHGETATGEATS